MQVTLSSGEVVTLRAWKRKADKAYTRALKQGVFYRRDAETGDLNVFEEVPANNFDTAWEAVLPLMIERIERDGSEIPFSQSWLDGLDPGDGEKLEAALLEIKVAAKAAGEKNTGATA